MQALLSGGGDTGGDDGLTGTPLDILLSPLMAALDGGAGACPLAGTPLDALCSVSDAFTGALAQDDGADLLGVLQGLLGTLLGGR